MNSYLESKANGAVIMSTAFKLEAVPISQNDILMELPLNRTRDTQFYLEVLGLATRDDNTLNRVRREIYLIVHMWSLNPQKNRSLLADRANKIKGFLENNNYSVSPVKRETLDNIFQQTMRHRYHALARPALCSAAERPTGLIQNMAETMEAGSSLAVIFAKSSANPAAKRTDNPYSVIEKKAQDVYRIAAFLTADKKQALTKAGLSLPNWQEYGMNTFQKLPRIHRILHSMKDLVQKDRLYPVLNLKQMDYLRRLPSGNRTTFPNTLPTPVLNSIDHGLLFKGDDGRKIGTLLGLQQPRDIFLHTDHLHTHTAILGTSGSGKTSLLMNFMHECYLTGGINYLCLDVEGYDLKQIATLTNADIYTVGKNSASPYPINPFKIKGLGNDGTCELLQEVLTNALDDLWGPLPQFIVDALKAMYDEGFSYERNCLNFRFLFEMVFDKTNHYGSKQEEMKAPPMARLRRLEELRGGSTTFSAAELLDRNTVIELGRMALDNRLFVLCFILKAVITAQRERYVRKKSKPLLIIIDEAHVVLQNTRDGDNKAANYLIGLINSIIKEGRKYGLYLILSDQSPIMLQGILPNVKCKLIMKEEEETENLAKLLRSEDAKLRLPILKTGMAYLNVDGMDGALLIKAPQPLALNPLDDAAVTEYMRKRRRLKAFSSSDGGGSPLQEVFFESRESAKVKEMTDWVVDLVLGYYAGHHDQNIESFFNLEKFIAAQYPKDIHLLPQVAKSLKKRFMGYKELAFIYQS